MLGEGGVREYLVEFDLKFSLQQLLVTTHCLSGDQWHYSGGCLVMIVNTPLGW